MHDREENYARKHGWHKKFINNENTRKPLPAGVLDADEEWIWKLRLGEKPQTCLNQHSWEREVLLAVEWVCATNHNLMLMFVYLKFNLWWELWMLGHGKSVSSVYTHTIHSQLRLLGESEKKFAQNFHQLNTHSFSPHKHAWWVQRLQRASSSDWAGLIWLKCLRKLNAHLSLSSLKQAAASIWTWDIGSIR